MFIHQDFKDDLKNIRTDIQTKYGLTDVDAVPNEKIIEILRKIFNDQTHLNTARLVSDTGQSFYATQILKDPTSIDDTFIRTKSGLFRRTGLSDIINSIETESTESELFKKDKVVRVCSHDKMRNLGIGSLSLRNYVGRHYKILGYTKPDIENIILLDGGIRYKRVFCEDAFGNVYEIPQAILVPTTIKDLLAFEKGRQLDMILENIRDSSKFDIETLTNKYQEQLRSFMDISKKLHEKLSRDYVKEAETILDMQINTKQILERNSQIAVVNYVMGRELEVETNPLFCGEEHLPIGRFQIILDLTSRNLKIFNIDIDDRTTYQHPHIQSSGNCCLGDRINPLRDAYSRMDYITLVGGIISYLEHLNPSSVYISMEEFQRKHFKSFKYSLKKEKLEKKKPIRKKLIEAEPEETVVMYDASATNEAEEFDHDSEPIFHSGDVVQVINDDEGGHHVGTIGTIVRNNYYSNSNEDRIYVVNANGEDYNHSERFLSLMLEVDG